MRRRVEPSTYSYCISRGPTSRKRLEKSKRQEAFFSPFWGMTVGKQHPQNQQFAITFSVHRCDIVFLNSTKRAMMKVTHFFSGRLFSIICLMLFAGMDAAKLLLYDDGGSFVIDSVLEDTYVHVAKHGTSLLLAPTASIVGAVGVYKGSTLLVEQDGGRITGDFYTTDLYTRGTNALAIVGDSSSATIAGGTFSGGNALSNRTFQKFGGRALLVGTGSTVRITGGFFQGGDAETLESVDGTFVEGFEQGGDAVLVSYATLSIEGGTFAGGSGDKQDGSSMMALGSSLVRVFGGLFYGPWILQSNVQESEMPIVKVFGSDLALADDDVLSGKLCDGSPLNLQVLFVLGASKAHLVLENNNCPTAAGATSSSIPPPAPSMASSSTAPSNAPTLVHSTDLEPNMTEKDLNQATSSRSPPSRVSSLLCIIPCFLSWCALRVLD
jgi:hypothetical protein